MGIPNLNRFLMEKCSKQSIQKKNLSCFSGKTIVIDTSIYLYQFTGENSLIEHMYLLISIFKYYNITPLFVFDGKPPDEKKDVLLQRKLEKKDAIKKHAELQKKLETLSSSEPNEKYMEEKTEIMNELLVLKKKMIRIREDDIFKVKQLMELYGITYYNAPGEADKLCAQLVITKVAWACLSDDMDMFVYGCTRVMRHISLLNHTVIFYNINGILRELQMPMKHFREIMVISGTDYNSNDDTTLNDTIQFYNTYKSESMNIELNDSFCEWLYRNTQYIKNIDSLRSIYKMFDLSNSEKCNATQEIHNMNREKMVDFLKPYGFIFV
jgi:hypothetical protein